MGYENNLSGTVLSYSNFANFIIKHKFSLSIYGGKAPAYLVHLDFDGGLKRIKLCTH